MNQPSKICIFITCITIVSLFHTAVLSGEIEKNTHSEVLLNPSHTKAKISDFSPTEYGPGYFDTSEYMIGTFSVGLIFVESNGQLDTDTEDWTTTEMDAVKAGVTAGINWWVENPLAPHLNWTLDVSIVQTKYEPITRPMSDTLLWVTDAMSGMGYDGLLAVYDYVNDLRVSHSSDWTFAIFVIDSSNDLDGRFSDGKFAFSNLGGPRMVLTYDNDGCGISNMNLVTAHELAHIFYATDEYDGITENCGYLNISDNNGANCIMGPFPNFTLCNNTREQVGWVDSDDDGIFDIVDIEPTIEMSMPDHHVTNDNFDISGKATIYPIDNHNPHGFGDDITVAKIDLLQYRLNEGPWQDIDSTTETLGAPVEHFEFSISPPEGYNSLGIRARSTYGLSTMYSYQDLLVDRTPPEMNVSLKNGTIFNSRSVNISFSANDTLSGISFIEYRVDNGTFNYCDQSYISLDNISDGLHSITIRISDNAGNIVTKNLTIRVDTNIFSISGPFGPWFLIVLAIVIASVLVISIYIYRQGVANLVECGKCGSLIPKSAKKCPKCGAEFGKDMIKCSECGALIAASSVECPNCHVNFPPPLPPEVV